MSGFLPATTNVEKDRRKGRGAAGNPAVRFHATHVEPVDDGWDRDQDQPPLRTEVSLERPRRVITRNSSPDLHFEQSINPYRGCEHGCIYCFARPSHAVLGLSPGLDFETKLVARPEAPRVLERELSAKRYRPKLIVIGSNTDPYQPIERRYGIMRGLLEVLQAFGNPVGVVTKGTLIERDLDILGEMGRAGLARAGISVTTLGSDLSRRLEPRAPSPARRLRMIERLVRTGCPVRVMVSPVIPGLTDHEMEAILQAARNAGAVAASYIMLRLPLEVAGLFRDWLAEHCPDRAARVMARVRDTHGGRDYGPEWGRRMTGEGAYAELVAQRFKVSTARLGLARELPPLRRDLFAVPPRPGDQLSLL
ncbi:MAG: PA0069 family radical SAM protein [Rhodobacteraceae bacterium]|nr:PA0069 family radical SAM protein [Paracoccaceae bacterium]